MAATRENGAADAQPVFCLLKATLLESLVKYLHEGQRKIDRWTALHRCATVVFDDAAAFDNANTVEELQRLQRTVGRQSPACQSRSTRTSMRCSHFT